TLPARRSGSLAEDELAGVAGAQGAAGRPPQDDLLDLLRQLEVLVGDPAGGVRLELHPELAPGDGEIRVVVRGLAQVADGVDRHERLRPALGVVLPPQPAVLKVPPGQAQLGDLRRHLGLGVRVLFRLRHGWPPTRAEEYSTGSKDEAGFETQI